MSVCSSLSLSGILKSVLGTLLIQIVETSGDLEKQLLRNHLTNAAPIDDRCTALL